MSSFNERWGIKMTSAQEWKRLKNQLKVMLGPAIEASNEHVRTFAFRLGRDISEVAYHNDISGWYIEIDDLIDEANSDKELAEIIESLMNSDLPGVNSDLVAKFINERSRGIRVSATRSKWITYPPGEDMLDVELVEKPLSFLYDEPLEEFRKALEHYSSQRWEESAEKVRRSLEEYLRQQLDSSKGLDRLITELAAMLSENKVPAHLKNTIIGLLRVLDKNFNESSKHNSKTYHETESELLIYLSGSLMRALNKISIKAAKSELK